MSKTNYQTVYGVKIYPIEFIGNHELTESELNNLLDNNARGLFYSLVIGMFKTIKSSKRNYQIIKMIKEDKRWMYKYRWSKEQLDNYEKLIIVAYKNLYQYKDAQAISLAQWFIIRYGFPVEGIVIDFEK
jgi:hypothetical protein